MQLRSITLELRKVVGNSDKLFLHVACQGSQLVLHTPPKREKSKELQDRLNKLQEQVDQASYNRMVSDVTKQVWMRDMTWVTAKLKSNCYAAC